MDPNEKIQLDDITFDDVIGGDGIRTIPTEEITLPQEEEKQVESSTENTLEDIGIEDDTNKE